MFVGPQSVTKPFAPQQRQAQAKTDRAVSRLPVRTIAQPPVVATPNSIGFTNSAAPKTSGAPLSRQELRTFINVTSPSGQRLKAGHDQIVKSIRAQVEGLHGAERVEAIDSILHEIQVDPRYANVRRAIRHYSLGQTAMITPDAQFHEAKPGPGPKKLRLGAGPLSLATINLTAAAQTAEQLGEKIAPGLKGRGANKQIVKNLLSDAAHLPLAVPQTLYEVGRASIDLAQGDTKRAKELAEGFLSGFYGHLIRGDVDGAFEFIRDHPVFAALEIRGGLSLAGRGAGAVMRSGKLGDRAQQAASTARADKVLVDANGTQITMRQHYSPDVITKFAQVVAEGLPGRGATNAHHLRRRADFESDTAAATARTVRSDEAQRMKAVKPKSKAAQAIVGMVSQGIVRPGHVLDDLRKELARLDDVYANGRFSTTAQIKQNRDNADAIRAAIANPAAFGEAIRAARENVGRVNELEAKAQALGAGTKERMDRAALFPAAMAHAGAEHNDAPFRALRETEVTAARALRERIKTATKTEREARDRLKELTGRHKSDRGKEAHHGPVAAYYLDGERFTMRQDAVARARENGVPLKNIRRVALTKGEAKRMGEVAQARRAYAATRAEVKALKSGDHPLRKAYEDAKATRKAAARGDNKTLNIGGKQTSNDELRAAAGLTEDVAFLPHHTKARGVKAFYQTAFSGRKNLDNSKARTGEAFRLGADDRSYKAVQEHRVRLRGVVSRIAEHDRLVHSVAVRGKGGRMFTWDQAEKIAQNVNDRGGPEMVPYRAVPGSYDKARIEAIAAKQNPQELPELADLMEKTFADRLKEPSDRTSQNVVLIPRVVADQLQEQMKVGSTASRLGNVAVAAFRTAVLPFSTKWLFGNIVEAGLRLTAVSAGINSHRIGRGLMREIDKLDHEQAMRVHAALTGGLMFGNRALEVRRFSEHFEGTSLETFAKAASLAAQAPVVKQLGTGIRTYRDAVFGFNRAIEHNAQLAVLGKYARNQMQEMTGSWLKATKAQEKALQDIARGMLDSKNVHDAAKYIDETLGQYSRFSPGMRRFIQSYAPFLPWYVNSVRFVYWTLPAKHPIKTAALALAEANLQADYDASHASLPPGSLKGDIVLDDGTVLPSSRYTPFGAFGELFGGGDDSLTALIDPIYPQFKGAALAAFGLSFTGRRANTHDAQLSADFATRLTMAVNSLAEAFIPGVSQARRLREGGQSPYDDSTVITPRTKPSGNEKSIPRALNRMFNPFHPPAVKGGAGASEIVTSPSVAPEPEPTATPGATADPWDHVTDEVETQTQARDPWDLVK